MPRNDTLTNLIRWLAAQLPTRQTVREAEWLAELDALPSPAAQLAFALGCMRATFLLQPRRGTTLIKWSSAALSAGMNSIRQTIRPDDGRDTTTAFYSARADHQFGASGSLPAFFKREERLPPEVELPPMNFSVMDEKKE